MYKTKCTSEGSDYFVVDFDARGDIKNQDDVCDLLRQELKDTSKSYTDVLVISHGYKNEPEEDGSYSIANLIVPSSEACIPRNRTCLYVAVGWPSIIPTVFDEQLHAPKKLIGDVFGKLHEAFVSSESNTTSRSIPTKNDSSFNPSNLIDKLKEQAEGFLSHVDSDSSDDEEENDLPSYLCESIAFICNELCKQGAQTDGNNRSLIDDGNMRNAVVTPEYVQQRFRSVRSQNRKTLETADGDGEKTPRSFSSIRNALKKKKKDVLFNALKKKQKDLLFTLFDLVYLTFERRAAVVGSTGVHKLLSDLMKDAPAEVRFHLFGHSMGSHVVQSAAIGASGSDMNRRIHTMILVQPACSAQPYAPGEPYRPIVTGLRPIAGPILCTAWNIDEALIKYDNWLDTPLGRTGFCNTAPFDSEKIWLKEDDVQNIEFEANTCYTLQAKDKGIIESHEDIADKEVLAYFWQAATIPMAETEFSVTAAAELPDNYWTDYDVRTEKARKDVETPSPVRIAQQPV